MMKKKYEDEKRLSDYDTSHSIRVAETYGEDLMKKYAVSDDVINLEQLCKRQDFQGMVERIEAGGANVFSAHLNIMIKLNDCDVNHEIKFVEVNEMQQPIRSRALFTLDEINYARAQ